METSEVYETSYSNNNLLKDAEQHASDCGEYFIRAPTTEEILEETSTSSELLLQTEKTNTSQHFILSPFITLEEQEEEQQQEQQQWEEEEEHEELEQRWENSENENNQNKTSNNTAGLISPPFEISTSLSKSSCECSKDNSFPELKKEQRKYTKYSQEESRLFSPHKNNLHMKRNDKRIGDNHIREKDNLLLHSSIHKINKFDQNYDKRHKTFPVNRSKFNSWEHEHETAKTNRSAAVRRNENEWSKCNVQCLQKDRRNDNKVNNYLTPYWEHSENELTIAQVNLYYEHEQQPNVVFAVTPVQPRIPSLWFTRTKKTDLVYPEYEEENLLEHLWKEPQEKSQMLKESEEWSERQEITHKERLTESWQEKQSKKDKITPKKEELKQTHRNDINLVNSISKFTFTTSSSSSHSHHVNSFNNLEHEREKSKNLTESMKKPQLQKCKEEEHNKSHKDSLNEAISREIEGKICKDETNNELLISANNHTECSNNSIINNNNDNNSNYDNTTSSYRTPYNIDNHKLQLTETLSYKAFDMLRHNDKNSLETETIQAKSLEDKKTRRRSLPYDENKALEPAHYLPTTQLVSQSQQSESKLRRSNKFESERQSMTFSSSLPNTQTTLNTRASACLLAGGDWFYKWSRDGSHVDPRWVWVDTRSHLLVWAHKETTSSLFSHSIPLEMIWQVTPRELMEPLWRGHEQRVYYVLQIQSTQRVLQIATQQKQKADLWYEALTNVLAFIRRHDVNKTTVIPD